MPITRALIPLLLVLPAACSPYVYKQEIADFGSGVQAIASSYQTGSQAFDAKVEQQRQADNAAARTRLTLLTGCDHMVASGTPPKLADCGVVVRGAATLPPPTPEQVTLAKAKPALVALTTYVAALNAVTNAADATTLTQAEQGLTSAVGSLAGAIGKIAPSASAASPIITTSTTLLGTAISAYLDNRRYSVLQAKVPAADNDVRLAARVVEAALLAIHATQLQQMQQDMHAAALPFQTAAVSKLSPADYQAKRTTLEAKVAAFNQTRAADPATTIAALIDAHHKLAAALQDGTGQAESVLATAQNFLSAAQKLKAAIDAATAASATKSK